MNKITPTKEQLTEEYITEYADLIDWGYVSRKINITDFSEEFFMKFKHEIQWVAMSYYNKFMTTEFAHKHEKEFGAKRWYQNGLKHREDGPSVIYPNGTKYWYEKGKLKIAISLQLISCLNFIKNSSEKYSMFISSETLCQSTKSAYSVMYSSVNCSFVDLIFIYFLT